MRFAVLRHGVIPAGRGGKLKTLVQSVGDRLLSGPLPDGFAPVSATLMGFAVVLTVATGLDYVIQAVRLRAGCGAPAHDGSTDGIGARPRTGRRALVGRGRRSPPRNHLTAGLLAATVRGGRCERRAAGWVRRLRHRSQGHPSRACRPGRARVGRPGRTDYGRAARDGRGNAAVPIGASG